MREWFTAQELAGLPGLPGTVKGVRHRAQVKRWQKRKRAKAKGYEFHISSFPSRAIPALVKIQQESPAAPPPAGGSVLPQTDGRSSLTAPAAAGLTPLGPAAPTFSPSPADSAPAGGSDAIQTDGRNSPAPATAAPIQGGAAAPTFERADAAWDAWERTTENARQRAKNRLAQMDQVRALTRAGVQIQQACQAVGIPRPTYYRYQRKVKGMGREHWAALLLDEYCGGQAAEIPPAIWDQFKALYLRRGGEPANAVWRRCERTAKASGVEIPNAPAFLRRLRAEVPHAQIVYLREGEEAYEKLMDQPMRRDHSQFTALEAINGDGWTPKPKVLWPDGTTRRPTIWNWQDIRSSVILAWRADQCENGDLVRLTLGDLIRDYGDRPDFAWVDNTFAAANTTNTGGAPMRYRFGFRVKQEEPTGVINLLGIKLRFTQPANGRAKPVERAHRDLRTRIDNSARYTHAGTDDDPIPLAEFLAVVEEEIRLHNAQTGRRGMGMNGRAFNDVFAESVKHRSQRVATAAQLRLCLLGSKPVTARKPNGQVVLGKGPMGDNSYWCPELTTHIGRKVMVRFDPADLTQAVYVYTLSGSYIGKANPTRLGGWKDEAEMKRHAREMKALQRCHKNAAKLQTSMDARVAAAMEPAAPEPVRPDPESNVVAADFRPESRPESQRKAVGSDVTGDADSIMNDRERRERALAAGMEKVRRQREQEYLD